MTTVYDKMTAIADPIRSIAGYDSEKKLSLDNMASIAKETNNTINFQADLLADIQKALVDKVAIGGSGGNLTLQDNKTVSPSTSLQTVYPDDGYDGLRQVTINAMPTTTQAKPSISVSSTGEITASTNQTEGYVSAGVKLTRLSDEYLVPENIKNGVTIFNVTGSYSTGSITVHSGSSSPNSSVGDNGDIYLVVI